MTLIFLTSYAASDVAFSYNDTPRFQLRASADSTGTIEVSVPTVLQSTLPRCIDCVSTWDNDQQSLIIEIHSNKTAYFYLDAPESISRLERLAESDFDRAVPISDELNATVFHSPLSREHVREIDDVVDSMQSKLTAKHYELVLHKLDRVEQLRTLALQEEDNYTRTEAFVNSVRQGILSSQGYLSKWQLVLLSQAYESLDQGNYTAESTLMLVQPPPTLRGGSFRSLLDRVERHASLKSEARSSANAFGSIKTTSSRPMKGLNSNVILGHPKAVLGDSVAIASK